MELHLSEKDCRKIAVAIYSNQKEDSNDVYGRIVDYVEIDGLEFEIIFNKDVDMYYEECTNSWITKSANVRLHDVLFCGIDVVYDQRYIEDYAEQLLIN